MAGRGAKLLASRNGRGVGVATAAGGRFISDIGIEDGSATSVALELLCYFLNEGTDCVLCQRGGGLAGLGLIRYLPVDDYTQTCECERKKAPRHSGQAVQGKVVCLLTL